MRITVPKAISELRDKLQFEMGRHLYGALGTFSQLAGLETSGLAQARDPQGKRFPTPVNLNRELLARIGDDELRRLVRDEGRRPQSIQRQLGQHVDNLLAEYLANDHFLVIKQLELVFAYGLDLSVFRTRATNQNHILLLLPGERRGDHVTLFHEAGSRFERTLPRNLIADNHLWELAHD